MSELNTREVTIGPIFFVLGVHAAIWAFIHTHNMYSDLFTTERTSIAHRRTPPPKNKVYKTMTWLTTISVNCYALTIIFSVLGLNVTPVGPGCEVVTALITGAWQIAKPTMYLTYVVRLHQCYALSAFGYGKKKLIGVAMFIIIIAALLWVGMVVGSSISEVYSYSDVDGKFPYSCTTGLHPGLVILVGGVLILNDLVLAIGSVIAFVVPINRVFKMVRITGTESSLSQKKYKKMLYAGYKYKVLVFCAAATSMFWILLGVFQLKTISDIFAGIDWTINMFCLMLMTPYYPDDKYYRKLCHLCICCCDRKKQSFDDVEELKTEASTTGTVAAPTASQTGQTQTISSTNTAATTSISMGTHAKSIDTMDAVEVVAKEDHPVPHLLLSPIKSASIH